MGRAKQHWEEELNRGYYSIDKTICADCMDEKYLSEYINNNGVDGICNYCKKRIAVFPLENIIGIILDSIFSEYTNPENGMAWESKEGGWQGEVYDTYDLIRYELELGDCAAFQDIVDSLVSQEWCNKEIYALKDNEEMSFAWSAFKKNLKHETRYVFFAEKKIKENDLIMFKQPYNILEFMGDQIESLGLINRISKGAELYRARKIERGASFTTASELGSPPSENAIYPNRMSPSGISMFYGAFDGDTCIEEIKSSSSELFNIAKWKILRDLIVIDFTIFKKSSDSFYFPGYPSIFDSNERWKRSYYKFLLEFTQDLSGPIKKDGKEHIEYVPTQVFAEYFRRVFKTNDNKSIDGIIYHSSKNNGKNCVLFCGTEGCIKTKNKENQQIIELVPNSIELILSKRKFINFIHKLCYFIKRLFHRFKG